MESVALLERNRAAQPRAQDARAQAAGPQEAGPQEDGPAGTKVGQSARRAGGGAGGWRLVAASGPRPCTSPGEADAIVPVTDKAVLALCGRVLPAADHRVLTAFAAQVGVALEQARLAEAAEAAKPLA